MVLANKISRSASQNDMQQLVSMAALAANDRTLYQMICGKSTLRNDVMTLFEDIAKVFLKVNTIIYEIPRITKRLMPKYICCHLKMEIRVENARHVIMMSRIINHG